VREVEERGRRCLFARADDAVLEKVDRMVAEVVERLGTLDVLVNMLTAPLVLPEQ
jgi:NAD(P)-dependent dehydrogenase (short-subunit alcohol dehydrogenase family)